MWPKASENSPLQHIPWACTNSPAPTDSSSTLTIPQLKLWFLSLPFSLKPFFGTCSMPRCAQAQPGNGVDSKCLQRQISTNAEGNLQVNALLGLLNVASQMASSGSRGASWSLMSLHWLFSSWAHFPHFLPCASWDHLPKNYLHSTLWHGIYFW